VSLLAQITAENIGAPVTGATVLGIGFFFSRWLMNTVITKMDIMLVALKNVERAMFLNTQATMLMGIAQDESSTALKEKLKACLKDLEEAEALRLRKDDDDRK